MDRTCYILAIVLSLTNSVWAKEDFPHGEGRDEAADEVLERKDLSDAQKRKLLYDNMVRFCGEP